MNNNFDKIFLQLKTQLNIETIKTNKSYSVEYPCILPDICIDTIKKQKHGETKIYFAEILSGYKGLLISNKENTFLAMGENVFYFDSEFKNYSSLIKIINRNHYSDNSTRFSSLFINHSRIESSGYVSLRLHNQYIKKTDILLHSNGSEHVNFFSNNFSNNINSIDLKPLKNNIIVDFQESFIKELIFNFDLKLLNVKFSNKTIKDLGINNSYHSATSYKDIVSLLKESKDLYFLSNDKKYTVIPKKKFDFWLDQIEFVVKNKDTVFNLKIHKIYDAILEPFDLIKDFKIDESSGLNLSEKNKEILKKGDQEHEDEYTMIKIALLQTFGHINLIDPHNIKSLKTLKQTFDNLNNNFVNISEKNNKSKTLKIK